MDESKFVELIHNQVETERAKRVSLSDQLTLGELIAKLEAIPIYWDKRDKDEKTVIFNFEYAIPICLDSWRGSYSELAINFDFLGYEHFSEVEPKEMKITDFIKMLKEAIGKEYTGWKGGNFVMGKTTPLWVANDGNAGNTAVIGVIDNGYEVILETGRREY